MIYGICNQTFITVRSEPREQSEMSSQILFGECYLIIEKYQNWHRVKNMFDGYEGWINTRLHTPISEKNYFKLNQLVPVVLDNPITNAHRFGSDGIYWLLAGSSIYGLNGKTFSMEKEIFTLDQIPDNSSNVPIRDYIEKTALKMLNIPYLWGGRSTFGIDCSGFSQLIYKIAGLTLKRDAREQFNQGVEIQLEETQCGDLAFFSNDEGNITHVGMILNDRKIIHSSGKVRIDLLDVNGIYNFSKKEYSHKLKGIRKLI